MGLADNRNGRAGRNGGRVPPAVSVLRAEAIESHDPGALRAVVSGAIVGTLPTGAEWRLAEVCGTIVVRPNLPIAVRDEPPWLSRHTQAWEQYASVLSEEASRRSVSPVVWATAASGQIVSDAPGLATFLRSRAGSGWSFLADPVGMLTPAMWDRAEEHLQRMAGTLLGHSACTAVLLREAGPDGSPPTPLREGGAMTDALLRMWAGVLSGRGRVVLVDANLDEQLRLISPQR